ncbi:hypothetical protein [Streptomyces sp. NPDC089795]|uniref:hypothetical protein n=1 Tax=Streptomyces sp. NPDC089795 TaxID=3155297 RepID=UPI00341374F0
MPGSAARLATLLRALLIVSAPAGARPVGSADGPADVALAVGPTAATATGWWLRSRYRRDSDGGDP